MLKIKYNNEYENDSWNKNPYKTEDGNIKEKSPLMPDVVNLKSNIDFNYIDISISRSWY